MKIEEINPSESEVTGNKFKLEIQLFDKEIVKLVVENNLENEELAEVLMTAFEGMKSENHMVIRVMFFAAMETLRAESHLVQAIWEGISTKR